MVQAGNNIRKDAWTDFELQCLYDVVNELHWYELIADLIPQRTENAARVKMSALRREAGIAPQHAGPNAHAPRRTEWQKAVDGSRRLRIAIEQLEAA